MSALEFDDLILHIPLCREHDEAWKALALKRQATLRELAKDVRLAGSTLDGVLAYAIMPVAHYR